MLWRLPPGARPCAGAVQVRRDGVPWFPPPRASVMSVVVGGYRASHSQRTAASKFHAEYGCREEGHLPVASGVTGQAAGGLANAPRWQASSLGRDTAPTGAAGCCEAYTGG